MNNELHDKNIQAFLDMIAWSEMGTELLDQSNNGYDVLVGSLPGKIKRIYDLSDHPRILVRVNDRISSTAAGRYQILKRNFDHYKKVLKLTDFSPESQDKIAIRMILEQGALGDVKQGRIGEAIAKVSNIWASLPGANYGQHEQKREDLVSVYRQQGGVIA